jgi:nucleotide-binding universal stress UspA family protein
MNKIQRIVFPVDFSRRSKLAAPHVCTGARRCDAEIVAIYFIDPEDNAASPSSDELFFPENLPVLEDRATRDLDFFCEQNLPACNVRRMMRIGEKANGISVLAQDSGDRSQRTLPGPERSLVRCV